MHATIEKADLSNPLRVTLKSLKKHYDTMFGANKNTTSLCMEENRIFFFYSSPLHVNVLIDKRMKSPRVIKSKTHAANLTL